MAISIDVDRVFEIIDQEVEGAPVDTRRVLTRVRNELVEYFDSLESDEEANDSE